jgi:alcohol dehydrogenase class IV
MESIYTFQTSQKIITGRGSLKLVSDELNFFQSKSILIITDLGIIKSGVIKPLIKILEQENFKYEIFDKVDADPNYKLVYYAVDMCEKIKADLIIGIGGGSSMDIAKVTSILATNRGDIKDYFGINLIPKPGIKKILIPTTAGTGSEVTPIAILSDEEEKLKKGIVSQYLYPEIALLDPELTIGLPPQITAATGMDALIHAIEAYTSINSNELSDMFAIKAIEYIYPNIRTAFSNGSNMEAREKMLTGSMFAGIAFANAGVTAVHAFAYPIGAEFHIPHGVANTIMFPYVMEFNFIGNLDRFAFLANLFGEKIDNMSNRDAALKFVESIKNLAYDLNVPQKLSNFKVRDKDIPELAKGVMKVTRLLKNNPRIITYEDAVEIYKKAL